MPRKKHRLSWKYEDELTEPTPDTAQEEDTLAASPVEVAHPFAKYEDSVAEAEAEEPPAVALEEETSTDAPAEDSPAREYPLDDAAQVADEPPATAEGPVERLLSDRPKNALKREAMRQFSVLPIFQYQTFNYQNSDGEDTENAQKLNDQAGEVVIVCTSCTTMLLIEYDGPCPYKLTSLMGSDHESYSWVLHTTCLSCVKKHYMPQCADGDSFNNKYMAPFTTAILSEEFMKQTHWFKIADRVCRKPTRIVMDERRRSVVYVRIDNMREETTSKCRMMGLRSAVGKHGKGSRSELIESFVPGGFM